MPTTSWNSKVYYMIASERILLKSSKRDSHRKDPRMMKAIAATICYLVKRTTFKIVIRAEVSQNVNMPTASFVLAIKHKITLNVRFKARNVI